MTTMSNQQTSKSPSLDQSKKISCLRSRRSSGTPRSTGTNYQKQLATGEYAKSFNNFCPTKVEINEATVDDVVKYGHIIKTLEAEMAKDIDIYKALGNDMYYGPEEHPAEPQQQQEQ